MISRKALTLIALNVVGVAIGYAITVVLARTLDTEQFARYVGLIATLLMLASIGEAGFGKYALKILPVYVGSSPEKLKGYLRFSILGCLMLTALIGLAGLAIELPSHTDATWRTIILAMLFLPAMACLGVALDLLCGLGHAILAGFISRIAVPSTTLVLVFVMFSVHDATPINAVLCFCGASLMGCLAATWIVQTNAKKHTAGVQPTAEFSDWIRQGASFMGLGFLVSWIFRATIVVADHVPHMTSEMALLAPALETGSMVILLSKSTDKYFQPKLSIIIERRDWEYGRRFRTRRYITIGLGVAVFLIITFVWGKNILAVFGPDYMAAYLPMCLFAVGSSVWAVFSLAPSFLIYTDRQRTLLYNLLLHGLLLGIATAILFPLYGALGAAISYATCISSLSLTNFWLAIRRARELTFRPLAT